MQEHPSISVVIPFYGEPEPTLQLVASLRAQEIPPDEIIISDDASPVPFPDIEGVQVVRRGSNGGFGAAVNSGVAEARGEYVLVLNSDIDVPENFVEDLVRESAPYQPCVAGPVLLEGRARRPGPTARHFPKVHHYAIEWYSGLVRAHDTSWWQRIHGHDLSAVPGRVDRTDWVVGAVMLIPRQDFLSVGGMDENFFMNCEEVDLQKRMSERGVGAVYVGTVSCGHEGGGSSDPARRGQWVLDARFYLMDKERGRRGRVELASALYAVSAANFVTNCARSIYNKKVRPRAILRREVGMIRGHAGRKPLVPALTRR